MNFKFEHPRFQERQLEVQVSLLLGKPTVYYDGRELPGEEPFRVGDDQGNEVELEVDTSGFDVAPKLVIDGEPHRLAPPLKWYEWGWAAVPAILIFAGGCIGGGIGGAAVVTNIIAFRSWEDGAIRWLVTGAITIMAVVLTLMIATLVQLQFNG